MSSTRQTIVAAVLLVCVYFLVSYIVGGCIPREAREAAAEATYLGQQLECVDNLSSKEDIDGCRASVKRRWGIAQTVTKTRDAGTE